MNPIAYGIGFGGCLAACAFLWLRRFPVMHEEELGSLRRLADVPASPAVVVTALSFWLGTMLLAVRGHHAALAACLWAALLIGPVLWFCARQSRAPLCEGCGLPTRTCRLKPRDSVSALVYIQVCPGCKTYREAMVLAIGGGD